MLYFVFVFFLCPVCIMLSMALDGPLLIVPSVFSSVFLTIFTTKTSLRTIIYIDKKVALSEN